MSIVPISLDPRTQSIACVGHNVYIIALHRGREIKCSSSIGTFVVAY